MTRSWPRTAVLFALLACFAVAAPGAWAQQQTFSASAPVSLDGAGQSGPSVINVSGMGGSLDLATVTLSHVAATSTNTDILLVAPHGTVMLLSDVSLATGDSTWVYDDELGAPQDTSASGTFRPTNANGGLADSDTFDAPAPTSGLYGTQLADLYGPSPNGTWQLYIRDSGGGLKTISGWSLDLHTNPDVSPTSKNFGSVAAGATSAEQTFTLTNTGTSDLNVATAAVQGPNAGDFTIISNGCAGQTVSFGASCQVTVAFKPGGGGSKTAALVITDDSGGDPTSIPLSGTGAQPAIGIDPTAIDFGSVEFGTAPDPSRFVAITNTGTGPLSVAVPVTPSTNDFTITIQNVRAPDRPCGGTLLPGEACKLEVFFSPIAPGAKSATITIEDNAPASPHTITLAGTATPASKQPPADPPLGTGNSDITIESAAFNGGQSVVAGQPSTLRVTASDDHEQVTGVIVDFGERLGQYALSACVAGVDAAGRRSFDIPYSFATAGAHTISVTVLAGGCDKAVTRTLTFSVDVRARGATTARRPVAHASDTIAGPSITSKCKNARMLPNKKKTKLLVKALLCVMNEQRKLAKLKPLKLSKPLTKAALTHTRSMVGGKFFAHQGPKEAALGARFKKVKYRGAGGENIGAGAGPMASPMTMVNGWMHSMIHRANLLSRKWKTVGIGILAQYPLPTAAPSAATFTTDFGVR